MTDKNNFVRLPWYIAWGLGLAVFGIGGAWARQEIGLADLKAHNLEMREQLARQAERLETVERRILFSRVDAESMRVDILGEVRRSRSAMNARMDDLEYRINLVWQARVRGR